MNVIKWLISIFKRNNCTIDESIDNDFNRKVKDLEECVYFVRGYKCNLDCEACSFCDQEGNFNNSKATRLCDFYKPYHKIPAEMTPEEFKWYQSLTKKQKSSYLKINE